MQSTKYTTAYPFDSTTDNTEIANNDENLNVAITNNYEKNTLIYGDGIRETSTAGTGRTFWYEDFSYYPGLDNPFLTRGGYLWDNSGAGLFYFLRNNGYSAYQSGFRSILVVS
ncbi:MAG: hypothetical protein ACLU84_07145 [Clostridia bacterium]